MYTLQLCVFFKCRGKGRDKLEAMYQCSPLERDPTSDPFDVTVGVSKML